MVAQRAAVDRRTLRPVYAPRGSAREAFTRRDFELVLDGPAGTGKTRSLLEKMHLCALKYAGMRGLLLRKVMEDLKGSALVTFRDKVRPEYEGVEFFHGNREEPPAYRYPNGSQILIGGLDKATKVMSKEFDQAYVNEATELTEEDWENLTTRLRNGVMPYQQLLGDCNPATPSHWLRQRADRGLVTMLPSRHQDNPRYWDDRAQAWTEEGADYIAKLERLTGVRRLRLLEGKWAAAEGLVYEGWDAAIHELTMADLERLGILKDGAVNRAVVTDVVGSVDWGFTNPGVLNVWAVDRDKRLYQIAEVYRTGETVADYWAPKAKGLTRQYGVSRWYCDPAEPAHITQFVKAGMKAEKATNDIAPGIQAVQDRLAVQADNRARLYLCRDALIDRDETLVEAKKPFCTAQEFDGYVWAKGRDGKSKEAPVDADNHGLDVVRYVCLALDAPKPDRRLRSIPWQ